MSASSSPANVTRRRSLSTRRGSVTASDPYGQHIQLNHEPGRSTSCKLSILRVISPPPIQLEHPPQSPVHRRHMHNHRRVGSGGGNTQGGGSPRMSFASSSFAAPGSPTAQRPGSPTHHRLSRASSITDSKPRLNADQLVALAHESSSPRTTPLNSPKLNASAAPSVETAPANFMALADDVYLPFVNRAEEVSALFSVAPCSKLLHLLSQTFAGSPAVTPALGTPADAVFELDPKHWSAPQLAYWLKKVDRDLAPDDIWVSRARRCILEHSELIWQRIKGALGVPPELDFDIEEVEEIEALPVSELPTPSDSDVPGLVDQVLTGAMSPEIPVKVSPPEEEEGQGEVDEDVEWMELSHDISIEPIIMGNSATALHDAPPTRPGAHTINESVQEEDEDGETAAAPPPPSPPRDLVQGIRISTIPASPGLFGSHSPAISSRSYASPAPVFSPLPDAYELAGASASSGPQNYTRTRSNSNGSHRRGYASSVASSDGVYDALAERGPGHPLFPSSFARLTLGPTLSANNPALRRTTLPPPPMFGNPHIIRGRRGPPSWAADFDPSRHEYAVFGSESSMSAIAV